MPLINTGVPWSVNVTTSGATGGTANKAAGATGVQHVADRVMINSAASSTVQPPLQVVLVDGTTVIGAWQVAISVNSVSAGVNCVNLDSGYSPSQSGNNQAGFGGLNLAPGASAALMALQYAAPAASVTFSCTLMGHDVISS